uniref:Transmembrane protein n=1 Tax=Davidia involucrata TaxID=16924 RepID=A0A5B7BHK5_DAVIN
MAISDAVVGNLTILYLAAIAAIKVYGLAAGRSFTGVFVLLISTTVVGILLIATLTWDVFRKAKYTLAHDHANEICRCRGGICWHGVAVRSPASQIRFRLPQQQPYNHLIEPRNDAFRFRIESN